MPTTVACFHCGASAAVDLDRSPTIVEYDYGEWGRKCAFPDVDGLALCANMRAILRVLGVQLDQPSALVECRRRTGSIREE